MTQARHDLTFKIRKERGVKFRWIGVDDRHNVVLQAEEAHSRIRDALNDAWGSGYVPADHSTLELVTDESA